MGQYHGGHGSDSSGAGRADVRVGVAAADDGGGSQVREDRSGCCLPRSRADQAV
jgi:hypothetical protein